MREATNEWSDLVNSSNVVRLDVEQFTVSLGDHHCLSDGERKRWREEEMEKERDRLTWWPPGQHSLQMNLHFAAGI